MNNPTPKQVQEIYKYTYTIYTRFKDSNTDVQFQNLLKECHELQRQYPFEMCEQHLLQVCNVIDGNYKEVVKE